MKIKPVILCGGAGTRLWEDPKKNPIKQFIDFGNWTLFGKTLDRVNNQVFDSPIISTNKKYIKLVLNRDIRFFRANDRSRALDLVKVRPQHRNT